jgi:hypothetical protein
LLGDGSAINGDEMIHHADNAMYQAKKAGRDIYRLTPNALVAAAPGSVGTSPTLDEVLRAVGESAARAPA